MWCPVRIRRGNDWTFSRRRAFHALGLDGTGALHSQYLAGVVRIARGGVWITARSVERANRGGRVGQLILDQLRVHG